jgi:hypothetical protein
MPRNDTYVVVVLELESDDVGVDRVFGIFNRDEAEDFADNYQVHRSWAIRGKTLFVERVEADPNDV